MNKEFTNYNIEELCVDPEYQRQGLGSEFMKMIEEEVRNRGLAGFFSRQIAINLPMASIRKINFIN